MKEQFLAAAHRLGLSVTEQMPLAPYTTFRIGGPAELFAVAPSVDVLAQLADLAVHHAVPITVLGGGSNVLISDAGVRGLVIVVQSRQWAMTAELPEGLDLSCVPAGPYLVADAGVLLAGLARGAIRQGWAGLEWAVSVPGTVGGAVVGNAGAHGGAVADNLAWAEVLWAGQDRRYLTRAALQFDYRSSALKRERSPAPGIVLRAAFSLRPGDPAGLAAQAEAYLARRRNTQPVEPSAGSIFRNPAGGFAGQLIEAAGLKGYQIGGAQISPRHANFIVNVGGARAQDVAALMRLAQEQVHNRFGIELHPEIVLLGDW